MLYDPKWNETKTEPSLAGLIAWLGTMPANGVYNFLDIKGCLICKYLDALGIKYNSAGISDWAEDLPSGKRHQLPGFERITYPEPWTFGAALERARKI